MDFDLSKEQEMIRKEIRRFAEKEIAPIAGELDETETFSFALTQKMGELGLFGMFVSDKYGGQEMDYISYIIAVEEIARVDGSQAATIAAGNSLGIGPIYYFGTEKQKRNTYPNCAKGTIYGALVLPSPLPALMQAAAKPELFLMATIGLSMARKYSLPMLPVICLLGLLYRRSPAHVPMAAQNIHAFLLNMAQKVLLPKP
ncbi:MAG: hypothetical protein OMM_07492 [Candidatus Magnetoglobus multicellularis str. Araruama]|uniref:Acyl-CoA dehydrogenase/oxidase N-terminal domain-containing protein n=1 Tax=Candidatus Magnetoglobus multicellularis str. Araruama TaxID=890399 RepID=A0A1V1PC36_9BACT|nr:MAG: hypothetical protein OMM_07492 [Candidatus Magnetoglobus multicellularis str. Araruama]